MQTTFAQRPDRGIALLVAVFALLLLSVIGLGMMYGTNMESAINKNYRDKQSTMYAAMAGLQEARDRIQPATLSITPPAVLPSLAAAGVVYLINPKNGETIAPWDPSPDNPYRDTELCQENILGLAGTNGVPCSGAGSLPDIANSAWRTVKDISSPANAAEGVWQFASPLDFKWVRLSLKKNNMTPYPATGNGAGTNQVCWDGRYQVMMPNGYGPECVKVGSVVLVSVVDPGANYTAAPTVTIAPPASGMTATAVANMVPTATSSVQSITLTNPGSNYNSAPIVTLVPVDGNGAGATAVATFVPTGASVASVSLVSGGTACYAVAPAVSFAGGGGSGATGTATLAAANSCIASWTVSGNCNGKKGQTINGIGLTGATGNGFSGTLTFGPGNGAVTSMSIENPGNNYTTNPTNFSGLNGCGGLSITTVLGRRVNGVSGSGGSGYTAAPTVIFSAGTGSLATQPSATSALGPQPANAGQITGFTITNGGNGYTMSPQVLIGGGGGVNAAGTAVLSGAPTFKVGSISITNPGYGYTVDPMVNIAGAGGAGATATATLGGGSNYGKVYLLTALAQTRTGGRSMLQMEVASPVTGSGSGAALVVDGPNPDIDQMPNSDQFWIDGHDNNSCGQIAEPVHPAVGAYDDPNADPPTNSLGTIVGTLPRPDHYIGEGDSPSVLNVFDNLGDTMGTTSGLRQYIDKAASMKQNVGNNIDLGSAAAPKISYVEGDGVLNGNGDGYGLLIVTGRLTMSGDFHWHGAVLVVGDGIMDFSGGGNGTIVGTVIVAKIWDSYMTKNMLATNGSPTVHWNGGGNNGIYYDHCWATNMMAMVPIVPPPSTKPLRILSLRSLPY